MKALRSLTGIAAPLRMVNVDTDMIIPKQYLKWLTRTGIGEGLFIEIRTLEDGKPDPAFVLNRPRFQNASILIAGDNFGSGSSREQAVWALDDRGIRCVVSTSFGDIFYQNCFKNGLLPARVSSDDLEQLFQFTENAREPVLAVDVAEQTISGVGAAFIEFMLSPYHKGLLLDGVDEIDVTLRGADRIAAFERDRHKKSPWLKATGVALGEAL
jgi:3-isopropylmalate/(R)-2-methylmalate dehydratase small subunit